MTKTKVIVCSNSGVDYIKNDYDIEVFRSIVQFSDTEKYDDYTEISAEAFYNRLTTDKNAFPRTAYVSPGHMIEVFEQAKKDGYDSALVIVISKPLSGLHDAVKLISQEVENFDVTVYNSLSLSYPEAIMAIDAARMFEEGKSMDEVIKRLDFIRDNHRFLFAVDTLEYLIKNGRLSKVAGVFANMLAIKPVLQLNKEGKVETLEKVRTAKGARKRIAEIFLDDIKDKDVIPFIVHCNAKPEVLDELEKAVLTARPELVKLEKYPLTPVVGAHTGPGAVCLGYIVKQ